MKKIMRTANWFLKAVNKLIYRIDILERLYKTEIFQQQDAIYFLIILFVTIFVYCIIRSRSRKGVRAMEKRD
jgi:hypothetical protein